MRHGIRISTRAMLAGFSPFCPWLDFHFQLNLQGSEQLTVQDYYRYSMDWLRVSDAVYVLSGWQNSTGTKFEIAEAKQLGIPVFYEDQGITVEALSNRGLN